MDKISIKEATQATIDKSTRADQKQRLTAWDKICEKIVDEKSELTVASVVRQMTNNGYTLSKTTVYNDNSSNHYQTIFGLWSEYKLTVIPKVKSARSITSGADGLFNIDLTKINDQVTRYQVSLMIGQLKAFKQQLDLAIKVQPQLAEAPSQSAMLQETSDKPKAIFDDRLSGYEVDILQEFLDSKLFEFDEDGKMMSATSIKRGASLSSEGFQQAIEKLLKK